MTTAKPPLDPNEPLRSVHSTNFPELLRHFGISLAVSTYQAGKLIFVRADGDQLNTHFQVFDRPMGMAFNRGRLAIGTAYQLAEFWNVPAAATKLEPRDRHDACFIPRNIHVTGDIDIHEMAYGEDELWFINTRFSCLCTLDRAYSFVPRWRPPFITGYDITDRCHLNGLAIRDGQPRYVTALGTTDTAEGWRKDKASGGMVMDVSTHEMLACGLSMPHSPRWYRDELWVLESGKGSLAKVNLETGELATVAQVPGFTRGLDFAGEFAFIGLSQIRESAIFSGIDIAKLPERFCGVWVVNIVTGETIALLRFEGAVQEIFSVQVLPQIQFPDIVTDNTDILAQSYILPDDALTEVVQPQPEDDEKFSGFQVRQGNDLYFAGKVAEAEPCYRKALALDPNNLEARYNLGVVLADQEQWKASTAELLQVIENSPNHSQGLNQLGVNHARSRNPDQAIAYYEQAITVDPDNAIAHHNLGMTLLQIGDYGRGWEECEWRWKTQQFTPFDCPQPRWEGEDLSGKTLLVHTEQGAGDAIQFARFLPWARERCQKLVLVCSADLQALFQSLAGVDEIWQPGPLAANSFDAYTPLMSLPKIFQVTTNEIPTPIPYLNPGKRQFPLPKHPVIQANSDQQNQKIHPKIHKIGIAWAGSPTQARDRDRSCHLTQFLPLLKHPNCAFYSLQKGAAAEAQLQDLPDDIAVINLGETFNDFADTAAAIAQLDLIITIDTSVAHLAGAMGKPTWVLLCHNPDWRWGLDGDTSPWYPTMRLFRQPTFNDWNSVFAAISNALEDHF